MVLKNGLKNVCFLQAISSAAKRAVLKHDYTAVLTVFPVAKHLSQIRPEFEETLQVSLKTL